MAIRRTSSQTIINRGVTAAAVTPVNIITGIGSGAGGATVNISSIQIANSTFVAKDDTAIETTGGYMIINGTGFQSGAVVYIQGTAATSTAFVSSSRLNVTVPALSSGILDVYVVNTDGSGSIYLRSLNANGTPSWTTTSPLTSQDDGTAFAINLVATGAAGDGTITYAVSSGSSLPSGTFLASNGYFYGTVSGITDEVTYSFSVDAIDAQNQETARTFNITVRAGDGFFKNTTLLLSSEASNNTWVTDVSTNNFAITVNGDARPSAFSPYETVWSNYFDGTGDFLTYTHGSELAFGTGDFTIEFWMHPNATTLGLIQGTNNSGWGFAIISGTFYWQNVVNVSNLLTANVSAYLNGVWRHWAMVRSSGTLRLYIDGQQIASASDSTNYSVASGTLNIGYYPANNTYVNGYLSNLRIVKGTAVYTSAFTPPTGPLTAITNTSLLTCQNNRFIDNSTNNFTITRNGNASSSNFAPFDETDTTTSSGYFDGSGDWLTLPSNSNLLMGSGNFTIEYWIYLSAVSATNESYNTHFSYGGTGSTIRVFTFFANGNYFLDVWTGSTQLIRTVTDAPLYRWAHVAIVRSGSTLTAYVNGTAINSVSSTTDFNSGTLTIGSEAGFGSITGYISNFRAVKGTAVYTSSFTPPTSPLTRISNTSLLTLQSRNGENNNRIVDLSGLNTPISRNGNLTQGTFSPYQRGGWSNFFDGTGDSLGWSGTSLTGDFTVECWVYKTAVNASGYTNVFSGSGNQQFTIDNTTAGSIGLIVSATVIIAASGTAVTPNAWHHLAWVREGSTCRAYVNGIQRGTGTTSASIPLSLISQFETGGYGLNGYMSNARIVNGTCLYPGGTTFTPPTAPLTPIANTALLTCADNGFIDDSPNNFAITRNGDVSVQPFSPFRIHTIVPNTHSVYFDGTGDYLQIPTNNALAFGTGDFTCESWVYISSAPGSAAALWGDIRWNAGYQSGWYTHINSNLTVTARIAGSWTEVISSATVNLNRWNHIAVSRQSGTFRLFVNGVLSGSASSSTNYTNAEPFKVGIAFIDGLVLPLTGYISNLRAVKGVAVYTNNFALPNVAPLQLSGTLSANSYSNTTNVNTTFSAANTSLLTCLSNTIIDLSTVNAGNTAYTITVNGDARPLPFNPLGFTVTNIQGPTADYSIINEGGSMFFDGNADFLKIDTTNILTWSGTTTFTVEGWFYQTAFDATSGFMNNVLGDLTPNSSFGDALYWSIGMNNSNQPGIRWYGGPTTCNATEALTLFRWNHVAWVVSSGVLSIYINGKKSTLSGTSTITAAASSMSYVVVGADRGKYYSGYMSGLRVLKGTALYTSGFVPPTAPPLPIAGSSLLINGTNGGIIDYTRKNNLETVGNLRLRNDVSKYGNNSIYFDGSGDFVQTFTPNPSLAFRTGDFTVECWVYFNTSGQHGICQISTNPGGFNTSTADSIAIQRSATGQWEIYAKGTNAQVNATINQNQWYHVAIVRSGTTTKFYVDGTSLITVTADNTNYTASYIGLGAIYSTVVPLNGHIDDFRVTTGVARYTSNFSAPNKHPTN